MSNCPEASTRVGISNLQYGNMLTQVQNGDGIIPTAWILLDTYSTDNVINNSELLSDIRSCSEDEVLRMERRLPHQ